MKSSSVISPLASATSPSLNLPCVAAAPRGVSPSLFSAWSGSNMADQCPRLRQEQHPRWLPTPSAFHRPRRATSSLARQKSRNPLKKVQRHNHPPPPHLHISALPRQVQRRRLVPTQGRQQ